MCIVRLTVEKDQGLLDTSRVVVTKSRSNTSPPSRVVARTSRPVPLPPVSVAGVLVFFAGARSRLLS